MTAGDWESTAGGAGWSGEGGGRGWQPGLAAEDVVKDGHGVGQVLDRGGEDTSDEVAVLGAVDAGEASGDLLRSLGLGSVMVRVGGAGGVFPLEGRSRLTCLTTAEAHTARAAAPAASWVGELRLLVDAQVIGSLKKKRTLVLVWWCAVSVLVSGVLGRDGHCHGVRGWGWVLLSWGFIPWRLTLSQFREF